MITRPAGLAVAALVTVGLLAMGQAAAEVLFRADFETGDFRQFGGVVKCARPGHAAVVTDVVHSGKYAGRFTIHDDDVFNARQLRVQVNGPRITVKDGTDTFMSFYLYMKDPPKDRDNFFYWEGSPPPRYQNVMTWWVEPRVDGKGTAVRFGTGGLGGDGVLWDGEFVVGRWHQLGMHIRWSENAIGGNVKLWWDGAVVLDRRARTKGPQAEYFCQPGIHRSPHASSVDTIYFDDFVCATTLEEINLEKPPAAKSADRSGD
jgi:hypothetical protein